MSAVCYNAADFLRLFAAVKPCGCFTAARCIRYSTSRSQKAPMILYLTKDLMLASNVRSVAKSEAIELAIVPSVEKLAENLGAGGCQKILVDLQTPGLTPAQLPEIVTEAQANSVPVVGYAQHVYVDLINAAKTAGFTAVFTRGQMNGNVAAILQQ